MHAAGIGGFFMHARSGLRTRYFSGEWFEAVKACIEEAAKLGMEPWLYDENGWPSGFGNGGVNGLGEIPAEISAHDEGGGSPQSDLPGR